MCDNDNVDYMFFKWRMSQMNYITIRKMFVSEEIFPIVTIVIIIKNSIMMNMTLLLVMIISIFSSREMLLKIMRGEKE